MSDNMSKNFAKKKFMVLNIDIKAGLWNREFFPVLRKYIETFDFWIEI